MDHISDQVRSSTGAKLGTASGPRLESSRRRRPALSCIECRRRKIKCNRHQPCNHCFTASIQCRYKVDRQAPIDGQQHLSSQRVDFQPSYATPNSSTPAQVTPTQPQQNDVNPKVLETVNQCERTGLELQLHILRSRVENLEDIHTLSRPSQLVTGSHNEDAGYDEGLELQTKLTKDRVVRWSHFAGQDQEFANIVAFFQEVHVFKELTHIERNTALRTPDIWPLIAETCELLQRCKDLARETKVSQLCPSLSEPDLSPVPFPRHVSDQMIALYFQHFESAHRILHIPSFTREYERYWSNHSSTPMSIRFQIVVVIAIGSALVDHGEDGGEIFQQARRWIHAAHTWVSGPLEKAKVSIATVQIRCLIILARNIFRIGGDLVFTSVGELLSIAMRIGLHRDPRHLPEMSTLQAELRRRLWATILDLTLQSALDSEMPPRIVAEEFDTQPPANVNDDEIDELTTVLTSKAKDDFTATSIQIALYSSLHARSRVLQLLNGLASEISYAKVLSLSSELQQMIRLPDCLRPAMSPFQRNLLEYLTRRFLMQLHCPFACRASARPDFYYSRKANLDAAMSVIHPEKDEAFEKLLHAGGGLFKNANRYASLAVGLELLADTKSQYLDGTLHRYAGQREALKQAVRRLMGLYEMRSERNPKNHMFMAMVLAEAEAMESGISCALAMARAARDSLLLHQTRASVLAGSGMEDFTEGRTDASLGLDLDLDLEFDFDSLLSG